MTEKQPRQYKTLRRVGALWKPKPGAKSLGSGSMTIAGMKQRFVIFRNDRKSKDTDPDYLLMAGDEPEVDNYVRSRQRGASGASAAEDQPF